MRAGHRFLAVWGPPKAGQKTRRVNAPILQVNDDFYEDMDAERTKALLEALKRGEIPKPGSMTGRLNSAPDGGPITLTSLNFEKAE